MVSPHGRAWLICGSLDDHAVAGAAPESLWVIHLLGLRRRHHEDSRRCRPRHVRVVIHALPQQRRESLDALIPHVLMLEPLPRSPPPPALLRGGILRILRNAP